MPIKFNKEFKINIEVFYNNQQRHSTLGYVSPVEFERRYYQRSVLGV